MICIIKVWKFIEGYVIIRLSGFNINKFINKIIDSDISLMNLYNNNGKYYNCCIHISKLNELKTLSKKHNCKVEIMSDNILSLITDNIRYRFVFLIGIFIFLIMQLWCSSLVWSIDIEGNNIINNNEILKFCNSNNLYVGSYIDSVNCKELAEKAKNTYNNISWINFSIKGTKVHIKLAEGETRSLENNNNIPCDIVADKDGIITNIVTDAGTPIVKKNDVISKGDILISGQIHNSGNEEIEINDLVHSKGHIRAKVTEKYEFNVPLLQTEKIYTDNSKTKYRLKIWQLDFADKDTVDFKRYDLLKSVHQLKINNKVLLPIVFFKYTYNEFDTTEKIINVNDAKNIANKKIRNYIIENYPISADILLCNIDYQQKDNILDVSAEIVSDQEIGKEQEITQSGGNLLDNTTETTNTQ